MFSKYVFFKKGPLKQNGGCLDTLDTRLDPRLYSGVGVRTDDGQCVGCDGADGLDEQAADHDDGHGGRQLDDQRRRRNEHGHRVCLSACLSACLER